MGGKVEGVRYESERDTLPQPAKSTKMDLKLPEEDTTMGREEKRKVLEKALRFSLKIYVI